MRILVCRHATVHNPDKVIYRKLAGFSLSDEGRKEAELIGKFLSVYDVDSIFSSPMERCVETASIIKKTINSDKPIIIADYLNEWGEREHTDDVARRMSHVLESDKPYQLYITHKDPLRVLLNKIYGRPLRDIEYWDCSPGSVYEINITGDKISAELLFVPMLKTKRADQKAEGT